MKVFKIRKKGTDNLFSSGGADPRWTTKGKTWASMGHVKLHMVNVNGPRYSDSANYRDAEIVEYNVVEASATDAATIMLSIENARAAKLKKQAEDRVKYVEAQEREQLRRLRAKFPNG